MAATEEEIRLEIERFARLKTLAEDDEPLISIKQVAAKYGVSIRTLRRWQAEGRMPEREKWRRERMYRKTDIALLMRSRDEP